MQAPEWRAATYISAIHLAMERYHASGKGMEGPAEQAEIAAEPRPMKSISYSCSGLV